MKVRLTTEAREELESASGYYERHNHDAMVKFVDDYNRSSWHLLRFPHSGRRVGQNVRRLIFSRFPYQLIYRVEGDEIVVYAVAHQKQRPGYWRTRVGRKG